VIDGKTTSLGFVQRNVLVAGSEPLTLQLDSTKMRAVKASGRSISVTTEFLPNGGTVVADTRRLKPS
jgi:hypothetical protein